MCVHVCASMCVHVCVVESAPSHLNTTASTALPRPLVICVCACFQDFPLSGFVEVRYDEDVKRVVCEPVELAQV